MLLVFSHLPGAERRRTAFGGVQTRDWHDACYSSAQMQGYDGFTELLNYLLRVASRQRFFVSVVFALPVSTRSLRNVVPEETMRNADAWFELGECEAVVMAHTEDKDALRVVERYKTQGQAQADVRWAIVSYPTDAVTVEGILKVAEARLAKAKSAGHGAAVGGGRTSSLA